MVTWQSHFAHFEMAVGVMDWLDAFIATHRSNESGKVIVPFLLNPKVTLDEPPCPSVANPA